MVLEYIDNQTESRKKIMLVLHDLFMSFPEITSKLTYKIPFYYRKKALCYLNPIKPGGVELVFTHGKELSNAQGHLQSKGRKLVAGISIFNIHDIDFSKLNETIYESFLIDDQASTHFTKYPINQ